MGITDRILTIVVTATLTSALWIVGGAGWIETAREASMLDSAQEVPVREGERGLATGADRGGAARSLEPAPVMVGELVIPVAGMGPDQLSDTFDDLRGGGERAHEAIDIIAPRGTPVLAAAAGTVEKLFRSDAGGNTIYVRSADGRTIHYYAHLARYHPAVQESLKVRAGQQLGTVGSTGNANPDAPHLHFAIFSTTPQAKWWEPATAINPYPLLTDR